MICGVIGLIISILALIANIIGLDLPYWLDYTASSDEDKESIYFGLWKLCVEIKSASTSTETCLSFEDQIIASKLLTSAFDETIGLVVVGDLLLFAAVTLAFINICARENNALFKFAGVLTIIAGIAVIVGACIFVTSDSVKNLLENVLEGHKLTPHAGFGACIVAGCMSLFATIFFFCDHGARGSYEHI